MFDIQQYCKGIIRGDDGIWFGSGSEPLSYPADGNDQCFSVEDSSFWFRHRNRVIISAVDRFPPPGRGVVWDLGGGNGFVASGLINSGRNAVLVEPGIRGVMNARKRGIENIVCATYQDAQFQLESLDAIGLFDVIEHVENDSDFLTGVVDLLTVGGRVYITVPSYSFFWSKEDELAGHYRRYSLPEICDLVARSGLSVSFSSYFFQSLILPVFLIRVMPYRLGVDLRLGSNKSHVQTGWMGMGIERLLNCEYRRLDQGKCLLFGTSCIIVATKE